MTVAGEVEVFVRVWEIVVPFPAEKPPALPVVSEAVHEKVTITPVIDVVNGILVAVPLQIDCAGGIAMTFGVGSTVTSKLDSVPGQFVGEGPVGVITYLTTPGEVPVLSKMLFIKLPQFDAQGK